MIGIIHLSDIHCAEASNPALGRVHQIRAAVQSESDEVTDLVLVLSGDVAFSGKGAEYHLACSFVADLEAALASIKGTSFLGTVAIPGNHDCDFKDEGNVRPALMSSVENLVKTATPGSDVVEQMLKVQEEFFRFEADLRKAQPSANRLFWTRELESSAGRIVVRCYNTAWLSREKEQASQLYFPVQAVPELAEDIAALALSVFHHPYGWLQPDNSRAFKRLIETTSDVVLTGHEHEGGAYTQISSAGANVNYVEGMALQADSIATGFNFIKVDLSGQAYQVRQFEWKKNMYAPESLSVAQFARNQLLLEHQFLNNSTFNEYLDDIGTPFSHPVKTTLTLPDLFVYPDLKITTVTGKAGSEAVVTSADVLDYVATKTRLSIAGAPSSGKTSLAKALYRDLLNKKKLVPLLLSGEQLKGTSSNQIRSVVEKAFEQQYSRALWDRFSQLDSQSRVVIVDDWHKVRLNEKGKALITDALGKMFDRVIVLTDDASMVRQITDGLAAGELPKFEYCEVKQFGYRLRGELVTKWVVLGREFEVEELELTHRISESEYLLDTLIGKGIVPAFPFFIFSVLQADDLAARDANLGSYGHIYHALLSTRLARVNAKNLGLKFAYLSCIAFHMFETGFSSVDRAQLKMLHEKYEKEYLFSMDEADLLRELEEGQVLSISRGEVRFRYKYGYYYFV